MWHPSPLPLCVIPHVFHWFPRVSHMFDLPSHSTCILNFYPPPSVWVNVSNESFWFLPSPTYMPQYPPSTCIHLTCATFPKNCVCKEAEWNMCISLQPGVCNPHPSQLFSPCIEEDDLHAAVQRVILETFFFIQPASILYQSVTQTTLHLHCYSHFKKTQCPPATVEKPTLPRFAHSFPTQFYMWMEPSVDHQTPGPIY